MRLLTFITLFSLICYLSTPVILAEETPEGEPAAAAEPAAEPEPEGESEPAAAEPAAAASPPAAAADNKADETKDDKDYQKDQAPAAEGEPNGEPIADEDLKQKQKSEPQNASPVKKDGQNDAGALCSFSIPMMLVLSSIAKFII